MTDIRRLDTKLLLAFDAVMEERSVSRAAVRLHLTQQGLSGVLNRLRDLFGDPLFVREARGVSPTPRAEALAPRIKAALASLEGVLEAPEFIPATAEGTIHVMTTDYVSSTIMPSLFRQFRLLAPKVKLAVMPISQTTQRERTRSDLIDLILAIGQFAPQGWRTRRLFKQGYICAIRAGHPLAVSDIDLDEFCSFEHLLVSPYNSDFNGPTDIALARLGRARNVGLVIPSIAVSGSFWNKPI
jgi:DNA-binding transcriptional LysR family regulator